MGGGPSTLSRVPLVVEVDSVRAAAGELPAGSNEEVEDIITTWLDIAGGLDKNGEVEPFPFQRKYPLLDGATFRVRKVDLDIVSPMRYGNVSIAARDIEVCALDSEGQVQDLDTLCKAGVKDDLVSFHRLYDVGEAAIRYVRDKRTDDTLGENAPENDEDAEDFLLSPTPVAVLSSQTKTIEDLYRVVEQRWALSFPGPFSVLTLPPFLGDAPQLPLQDRRLCPYPGPTPQWSIHIAKGNPCWGLLRPKPLYKRRRTSVIVTATICMIAAVVFLTPRPWLRMFVARL